MKSLSIVLILMITLSVSMLYAQNKPVTLKPYPSAKKDAQIDDYFGTKVADPYRWLEDDKSKETATWVKEENEVTQNYLEQLPYRNAIKEKLSQYWNFSKMSVPEKVQDKLYYLYNTGLQNQDVLKMGTFSEPAGKVIVDPNLLSPEGNISISGFKVSKDGKYLAYSTSEKGSDWNRIYVFDLKKMKLLDDVITGVKFSEISWKGNGFYYSKYPNHIEDEEHASRNELQFVYYHALGTPEGNDILTYYSKQFPLRNYTAEVTENEKYLLISASESTSGNALYIKDLTLLGEANPLISNFKNDWDFIGLLNDSLLVRTNFNAPNYQLVLIDPKSTGKDTLPFRVLLPENPDMVLNSASFADNFIFTVYTTNATSSILMLDLKAVLVRKLDLPGLGTVDKLKGWKDSQIVYYSYTSFTQSPVVFAYNLKINLSNPFMQDKPMANNADYVVEQVTYTSFDQTSIPMFLVYKKGLIMNGSNPALLYGYGGFNISMTPAYSPGRLLFVDNGGILAVPCLRGGGEFGEKWHKAGTKDRKQVVFNDFIAAAHYLIDKSYTNSSRLAIQGGSNGGLLVGACMTQHPEMFKVALPAVGVMDMLRFHLFTIGWAWKSDYGSSEDKEGFDYLYKYSPLHNIKEGVNYPATLVTTGDHDNRVVPAHSFKFAATLQEKYKGSNPMLIRIQSNAGHGAGKSTTVKIEETADILAFTFYQLGMSFKQLETKTTEEAKVKDKKTAKNPEYVNDPVYRMSKPMKSTTGTTTTGKGQEPPKK